MAKRLFDLVLAATGLLLLAPLLLVLALLVALDSPGPMLFRQQRVGRGGRLFHILKLRTMRNDAATTGPAITIGQDARITRAGRWLRATRLDELPQLWNVLIGDMSLVGPRPEVPHYVALYPDGMRRRVLAVRPGLTDPSSLAHVDEAQELAEAADPEHHYVQVVLPRKLQAAVAYAEQATLRSDLQVLLRTLGWLLGWRRSR